MLKPVRKGESVYDRFPKTFKDLRDLPFVEFRSIRIFLETYNVNSKCSQNCGESFPEVVSQCIQLERIKSLNPEICVLCLQECGSVNRLKGWLTDIDSVIRSDWRNTIEMVLAGCKLRLFCESFIGCTYLMVFVHTTFSRDFKFFERCSTPMGFCWNRPCKTVRDGLGMKGCCAMADKGACLIKFGIQNQTFLAVGVHLNAHDHCHKERMKQIDSICTAYSNLLKTSHFIFWLGDFNFRAATSRPVVDNAYFLWPENNQSELFNNYLKLDQWYLERANKATFPNKFAEMQEAEIKFPPSYKFINKDQPQPNDQPSNHLHLESNYRPSWCDRIFYLDVIGQANMTVEVYDSDLSCLLSDHKPVFAIIKFDIEYMDIKRISRDRYGGAIGAAIGKANDVIANVFKDSHSTTENTYEIRKKKKKTKSFPDTDEMNSDVEKNSVKFSKSFIITKCFEKWLQFFVLDKNNSFKPRQGKVNQSILFND